MEVKVKFVKVIETNDGINQKGEPWHYMLVLGETEEQYPKKICFKIFNKEKLFEFVGTLFAGKLITVKYDIDSREFNGRWYTDIMAYDIY